jgi:pectin methylesterase-like acyl-CoA thioesterase
MHATKSKPTLFILLILFLLPCPAHAKNIIVAQDGSGSYRSIGNALMAARAGDSIFVKPGEYRESLVIKKHNISITGAGYTTTRLIAENAFPVKLKKIKGFKLEGFFIKAQTRQGHSAMLISDSEAIIRHCVITSGPEGGQGEHRA